MSSNKILSAACLVLASPAIFASGFALIEQSASGQGLSYAGAAANAEDASIMWFNPAGLSELNVSQTVVGGHFISPHAAFTNDGSEIANAGGLNGPITGSDDNGSTVGFVPNLYWKGEVSGHDIGLGINVPFGQHISYDPTWVGRYHATQTNLKALNINSAVSKSVGEKLKFGFGLNAQHVDLEMQNKVDNRLAGDFVSGDGNAKLTASSWAFGYNFGLLYKPAESTNLGLSYRSSITHFASGYADYTNVTNAGALTNVVDATLESTVTVPGSASLSLNHAMNPKFQLLADATWTQWSDYKELVIDFHSLQADGNTRQDFKDSWRVSLGGIYQLNKSLKLRAGVAFDQTPVSDPKNRSPRTPDGDRKWLSAGLGYKLTPNINLDLAYSHLYAEEGAVNYTTNDVQYLIGSYDADINIFSAQLVWKY
ncbi:MAG: long-chain fatty acid transport protein [Thiomicrorhabdus sp.]|nr:MAG: long-chain fatty acid transport protein [Thiomicrorhabdus sp.]